MKARAAHVIDENGDWAMVALGNIKSEINDVHDTRLCQAALDALGGGCQARSILFIQVDRVDKPDALEFWLGGAAPPPLSMMSGRPAGATASRLTDPTGFVQRTLERIAGWDPAKMNGPAAQDVIDMARDALAALGQATLSTSPSLSTSLSTHIMVARDLDAYGPGKEKAHMMGEFYETIEVSEEWEPPTRKIPVSWTTIKAIRQRLLDFHERRGV